MLSRSCISIPSTDIYRLRVNINPKVHQILLIKDHSLGAILRSFLNGAGLGVETSFQIPCLDDSCDMLQQYDGTPVTACAIIGNIRVLKDLTVGRDNISSTVVARAKTYFLVSLSLKTA
jgi:hypothetical protein